MISLIKGFVRNHTDTKGFQGPKKDILEMESGETELISLKCIDKGIFEWMCTWPSNTFSTCVMWLGDSPDLERLSLCLLRGASSSGSLESFAGEPWWFEGTCLGVASLPILNSACFTDFFTVLRGPLLYQEHQTHFPTSFEWDQEGRIVSVVLQ